MKKKLKSQNIEKENNSHEAFEIPTFDPTCDSSCEDKDDSAALLEELKEGEQKLLVQERQIRDTLVKWQSMFDSVADKKSRLLACIEKEHLSKQQNSERARQPISEDELDCKLFSVVTWGSSLDGLVFTVIAENNAWAEELVRQWLESNGRQNHRIDKVMALISQDARGIINVGAKLIDV